MIVLSVDFSWIDFPMLQFFNLKNSGHGGFAVKIFGFAVRSSLLRLSRRGLVSTPSCIERSLKRAGE